MILLIWLAVIASAQNVTCPTNCTCIVRDVSSITCLDESYEALPDDMPGNLSRIDMSRNQFEMKSVDSYASTLTSLTLKNNRIRKFDIRSEEEFGSIVNIDVSYNQIQYIDWKLVAGFPQLQTFRINGNKLTSLSGILANIRPGLVLYLLDNPFYCSCQAINFTKVVAQRGIRHQFSKYDKIVCRTNNPLPDTIQAEHLSQLAEMESCEAENLYFSLYDRGSKSTIATNVTEYRFNNDRPTPISENLSIKCHSQSGFAVKLFHGDTLEPTDNMDINRIRREALFSCIAEINNIRTEVTSLTIFPYANSRIETPEWSEMNETESCSWLIENSVRSTMTWKMHRSKIYRYQQTGCKLTIKQDASVQTTSMELDIGRFPGRPVELRYCLGDGIMKNKMIRNTNLSRNEKVTFHFDPLPNRLCFLADCMFPGKPICIDVQDAGHQDYLVMIFSIAVVGLAGFGMLSALAHFILRLKTKPARKLQIPEFAKKSLRYRRQAAKPSETKEDTLIITSDGNGKSTATLLYDK